MHKPYRRHPAGKALFSNQNPPLLSKAISVRLIKSVRHVRHPLAIITILFLIACTPTNNRPIGTVPEPPPPITQLDPYETNTTAVESNQTETSARIEDRWAVVIGLSRYQHAGTGGLTNLIYADEDALDFSVKLKEQGWPESRIKLLLNENATRRNILIALQSWLTKAKKNDLIVLYWSGHGYPDPEDPEKVYFACYDTDITIPATGYRMDEVRESLAERKTRNVVVLADTCHAGKLITRSGERGVAVVPYVEEIKKQQNVPKGWIFMVGADTDRLAIENSSWTNGAFTHVLLRGMDGAADGYESAGPKDGLVTLGELRAYIRSVMPDMTQKSLGAAKHPVITTSTADPDIWNLSLRNSR
ncbi:MAG: caspase domain-containing protein [Candidatus Sumerlaeia bacterium]